MSTAQKSLELTVDNHQIGPQRPVFIIAEIGVNHDGSLAKAKRLIRAAQQAGADAVKFQKRDFSALYPAATLRDLKRQEHGFQYAVEMQKKTELTAAQLKALAAYARRLGIIFFATPFDEPSVTVLAKLSLPLFKIGSPDLTNWVLLEKIIATRKPLIISTGMATQEEVDRTVDFLKKRQAKFALLHCHSTYPANLDDLNLSLIPFYQNRYQVPVGYSGHERDIDTTVAAVAFGACVIERHLTYDKNAAGPDHAASLEPDEFRVMVQRIRKLERARGTAAKIVSQGELANRLALAKSLVAAKPIPAGTVITRAMLTAKTVPERGLSPQYLYDLVGRRAPRAIGRDAVIRTSDLGQTAGNLAVPIFASRWGLKSDFKNYAELLPLQPRLLEFHLTEPNLVMPFVPKVDLSQYELYVHVPVYGQGHFIIDLCSPNERLWKKSIAVTQGSIDLARRMGKYFAGRPKVVMHVGGMTLDPMAAKTWPRLLRRAVQAIKRLDTKGVDFLPENLTALAWHFSGQYYQNVFNKPGELTSICRSLGLKMCFDTAHAWVAAHYFNFDYYDFVKECAPYIAHLHLVDAKKPSGEGFQIGEGEIDFKRTLDIVARYGGKATTISWLPEIWQGHLDNSRGFKVALQRLGKLNHPWLRGKPKKKTI